MLQKQKEFEDLTEILSKFNDSNEELREKLFLKVYDNLKCIARKNRKTYGRTNPDETFCTDVLVHEVFVELRKERKEEPLNFSSRIEFFSYCSKCMRSILHDHYLRKRAKKVEVSTDFESEVVSENASESEIDKQIKRRYMEDYKSEAHHLECSILVTEALSKLEPKYPSEVEVILLKYGEGATFKEIAEKLGKEETKVKRMALLIRVLIRRIIATNEIDPILKRALDIKNFTLRDEYLKNACGGDPSFIRQMKIILKEHSKGINRQ